MVIVLHKLLGGNILWTPLTLLGFYNDVGLKFSGNFNAYIVICIWVFIYKFYLYHATFILFQY